MAPRTTPDPPWIYTLTIAAFLIKRGVPPTVIKRWGSTFGRLAKRRFMQINGFAPCRVPQWINGSDRPVFAYRESDIAMLDDVWDQLVRRMNITY